MPAKPLQPMRAVPATVLGSSNWAINSRPLHAGPQLPEKRRVQIPRAWSQPVPPARCIPVIPANRVAVTSEGDKAHSTSPRRLSSRAEDWRRCMWQLNIIRDALKIWPSASTELALQEALDFASRCGQKSDSWTAQELRCFGLRMLATHGLEAVDWPAGQWLSMLHTVDHEPGKNNDRTTIEPLRSEDAAKLGKLAFQTLQTQLETEVKRFGNSESTTAVVSPSSISSSGTWQTMGAAGPYVQIIGNVPQSARRLKASPRNRERPMVGGASGVGPMGPMPAPEPVQPLPAVVPVACRPNSSLSIETELAQLRQEIATERLERQHLARLVDSLVKERQAIAVPKRRCDESKGQEWLPGFRPLEEPDFHRNDAIAEEDGDRTLDISFFQREPQEALPATPSAVTEAPPQAPGCSYRSPALPLDVPVKDSLLADASAALDRLEEILGGDRPPEAPEAVAVEVVPKGSPGFNLERETHDSQDLQFYRRRCLELAEEVQKREAELIQLRQALQEASQAAS